MCRAARAPCTWTCRRRAHCGARQDSLVEIVEGVQADERVVVEGAGFLSDGDRVRVVATTAE
jgi:hypothetical protein